MSCIQPIQLTSVIQICRWNVAYTCVKQNEPPYEQNEIEKKNYMGSFPWRLTENGDELWRETGD